MASPFPDGRVGAGREGGHLTASCVPSLLPPVKVDRDRQMVVLEEEFQVRGWRGDRTRGGTRGTEGHRDLEVTFQFGCDPGQ